MANLDLTGSIQLRSGSQGLGADYEKGSVISRIYEHGEPLMEQTLLDELDEMVQIYEAVLTDERYVNEIKGPIDQALMDAGHLKDGRKRKSLLMLRRQRRRGRGGGEGSGERRAPGRQLVEAAATAATASA